MAEKAEKKSDEKKPAPAADTHGGDAAKKKGGGIGALLKSTPGLLAVVMIVEAGVLFAGFKMLGGGPKHAEGAELATEEVQKPGAHGETGGQAKLDPKKLSEIPLVELRAPNKQRGRSYLFDVAVVVQCKGEFKERVEAAIKAREGHIRHTVRTIIAQCDPEKLDGGSEPGLETLCRQIKVQLVEIVGDGLIENVLVTKCIPMRND